MKHQNRVKGRKLPTNRFKKALKVLTGYTTRAKVTSNFPNHCTVAFRENFKTKFH